MDIDVYIVVTVTDLGSSCQDSPVLISSARALHPHGRPTSAQGSLQICLSVYLLSVYRSFQLYTQVYTYVHNYFHTACTHACMHTYIRIWRQACSAFVICFAAWVPLAQPFAYHPFPQVLQSRRRGADKGDEINYRHFTGCSSTECPQATELLC